MDITLQVRSIDLLIKFLKHELQTVPSYGYSLQKQPVEIEAKADVSTHMERSLPEAQGVDSAALERFFAAIESESDELGVHGAIVLRHGRVIGEAYWEPYKAHLPHMLYSMSKSVTATAIGILVDEGRLSLDERLGAIFDDVLLKQQALFLGKNYKELTVRHLLTMSTGSRFNEVGSVLDEDWVRMFMESTSKFEAGSRFEYNSLNTYMLAAIIARRTGMGLAEYLRPRLFEPLGIGSYEWEKCPMGIEKGGWGLSLTLEDAAKLGQLYLNGGRWNDRQIVSERYIKDASIAQIATPEGECKHGYGYQIWIGEKDGAYQFNGAFGQYVIVLPKQDAVIALFSGSVKLFDEGSLLSFIYDCFNGASDEPLTENIAAYESLCEYSASLRVLSDIGVKDGLGCDGCAFDAMADRLHDSEYRMERSIASLFPQTIQAVHSNYTVGVDMISFKKIKDGLAISFYEYGERNTIVINRDGSFSYSRPSMRFERQIVGVRGVWNAGGDTLIIICSFIETPDTRIITISFKDDGIISASFDESPSISGAVSMLFKLVGLSERVYFKRVMQALRGENISASISSFAVPSPRGILILHNEEETI